MGHNINNNTGSNMNEEKESDTRSLLARMMDGMAVIAAMLMAIYGLCLFVYLLFWPWLEYGHEIAAWFGA